MALTETLRSLADTFRSFGTSKPDAEWWRRAPYPDPLFEFLKDPTRIERLRVNPGRRKARYFAAGCCRRVENLVRFPHLSSLLGMVEEYARGGIGLEELLVVARQASADVGVEVAEPSRIDALLRLLRHEARRLVDYEVLRPTPADRLAHAAYLLAADGDSAVAVACWKETAEGAANAGADLAAELQFQADLLRDLFGNPFVPVAFSPAWRSAAVLDLAAAANDSGDYTVMPILADALQEAGCEDAEVLGHCRAAPVHARGCWVLDAVFGS